MKKPFLFIGTLVLHSSNPDVPLHDPEKNVPRRVTLLWMDRHIATRFDISVGFITFQLLLSLYPLWLYHSNGRRLLVVISMKSATRSSLAMELDAISILRNQGSTSTSSNPERKEQS